MCDRVKRCPICDCKVNVPDAQVSRVVSCTYCPFQCFDEDFDRVRQGMELYRAELDKKGLM
jgi:hypothetical protein